MGVALGMRFLESTRGRIVALLRRGTRTVDELAASLELTSNAVRSHLAALERDRLVRRVGVRRTPGAGKPALLYELHPDAEPLFSTAYPPVLTMVVDALVDALPPEGVDAVLRDAGRRLAEHAGGLAPGELEERVRRVAGMMTAIGADVEVTSEEGTLHLRGTGCPLSAATARRPELCRAIETLVAEVVGAPVRECCERGDRPRCCFAIGAVA